MNTRALACAAMVISAAAECAAVSTNYVNNGTTDWTVGTSYRTGAVPAAGDVVVISNGYSVSVSDAASLAVINTFKFLKMNEDATITFDVPAEATGDAAWVLNKPVTPGGEIRLGSIVKNGPGTLGLNSAQTDFLLANACREYFTKYLTVNEGVLRMKQGGMNREMMYGNLYVEKGATVVLNTNGASGGGTSNYVVFQSLTGEGDVTCPKTTQMRVSSRCTFEGTISGSVQIGISEPVDLVGTKSTTHSIPLTWVPAANMVDPPDQALLGLGVMSFGSAVGVPSSIGTNVLFYIAENYGGYRYLGEGETTSKQLYFNMNHTYATEYAFIDGGAHGGLTFTGDWYASTSISKAWAYRLFLLGSNTTECVLNNSIKNSTYGGVDYPFLICKRGSGAWRFAKNTNPFSGSIAIDEGTIRYNTLEDAGLASSLGTATRLLDHVPGTITEDNVVGWAYRLGNAGQDGANTTGTLEYSGTKGVSASGRSFALKGDGRLLNDTSTRVAYSLRSPAAARTPTTS